MNKMPSIIPVSPPNCQVNSWKFLLKTAVSDPMQLLSLVGLKPESLNFEVDYKNSFKLRVPKPFIDKMQYGVASDPLLLQVLSQQRENITTPGFSQDPLKEFNNKSPGLLHKYHGRILLILASACAINCRYCFRRHFPYQEQHATGKQLVQSINYINSDTSIKEVILSGGDPLVTSDESLTNLIEQLKAIPHIKRLRIHTRLPIVIPQRVTQQLCNLLKQNELSVSMVLHINHPNEIDALLKAYLSKLSQANVQLLNQTVLLKGINDNANTLVDLSESLFDAGVLPYYIHLLDKVAGAAHFDISQSKAIALVEQIRKLLPGYLVPRLTMEEPGKHSKSIII